MFKFILIFSAIFFSAMSYSQDYLDRAHNSKIKKCDKLINENFSFFNYFQGEQYHLETSNFSAPDNSFKTIRYYFNSGFVDPILGDLTVVQSDGFCQSSLNITMIDNEVSCDVWKNSNGEQWNNIVDDGVVNWASNNKYKALFQRTSNGRGCQVTFYITNISETE